MEKAEQRYSHSDSLQAIQNAVLEAQSWLQYEGVALVTSARSLNNERIVVFTLCNPAAITAPIPSTYHGFSVIYRQISLN